MNKTSDEIQRKFKIKMSTLIKTFNLTLTSHLQFKYWEFKIIYLCMKS